MVEVNKRLYLDNQNTEGFSKSKCFEKTKTVINEVLDIISQEEISYNCLGN